MDPKAEAIERRARYMRALKARGLTNAEVARRIEVKRGMMSAVMVGRSPAPHVWTAIAKALKIDPQWLLTGHGSAPSWEVKSTDYAGALASIDAAAAIVQHVAAQRGQNGATVLKHLKSARAAIERL